MPKEEIIYICEYCGRRFQNRVTCLEHEQEAHKEEIEFKKKFEHIEKFLKRWEEINGNENKE